MHKLRRKWRRKSVYNKTLSIFTIILIILGVLFLIYVYKSLVIYERNIVDNYIKYLASSGKITENIDNNLFEVSKYEKSNAKITDGIKKLLKSDNLEIKKNKDSNDSIFVYDLKVDDNVISTVSLKSVKEYTKMAILKINEWEVTDIKTYFDNGIYSYEIVVPSNYKVSINNKELDKSDIIKEGDIEGLERLTEYVEINKSTTYKVDNLVYKPNIKITDENKKEIDYEINNNKIVITKEFKEIESLEDAKKYIKDDFNILELAENYSLFLTNDLGGTLHGFYKLSPYLIRDSYMYEMAHGWATQVDITFVSNHRLSNPVFTNESVNNFIIYNDDAFSVEVNLEKNMIVNGQSRIDKMHDRLYFVYYDGGYKLVDMKSI